MCYKSARFFLQNNPSKTHATHDAPRKIRMDELEFLDKIGKGATSVVYAVNMNNRLAAAKKVSVKIVCQTCDG